MLDMLYLCEKVEVMVNSDVMVRLLLLAQL